MLEFESKITVDPAFCIGIDPSGNDEVLFVSDKASQQQEQHRSSNVDVGSIQVLEHSLAESVFSLGTFVSSISGDRSTNTSSSPSHHIVQARAEEALRGPKLAAGLLSSGSKVVAYSTEGHIACYDRAKARSVLCNAATLVLMTRHRRPVVIRCAAAARAADDVFFFSLVGAPAVHVLYFAPGRDGSTVARMTAPIRIDSKHLEAEGVTLLECHPTQPHLVVAGADGPAEIFSYAPLLQRLRAIPLAAVDASFNADASFDAGADDDNGENLPSPASAGKRSNMRLFGLFARSADTPADLALLATITAPPLKKLDGAVGRVHRVSLHPAGGLLAAVFEYHNNLSVAASHGGMPFRRAALATYVCVYEVGSLLVLPKGVGRGGSGLEAVAANRLRYCEFDPNFAPSEAAEPEPAHVRGAHRAVFSVCFHPAEPLLLLGLVARYPVHNQPGRGWGRGSASEAGVGAPVSDMGGQDDDENYEEDGAFQGPSGQQAVSIW